jgi:hypothetical protein
VGSGGLVRICGDSVGRRDDSVGKCGGSNGGVLAQFRNVMAQSEDVVLA